MRGTAAWQERREGGAQRGLLVHGRREGGSKEMGFRPGSSHPDKGNSGLFGHPIKNRSCREKTDSADNLLNNFQSKLSYYVSGH